LIGKTFTWVDLWTFAVVMSVVAVFLFRKIVEDIVAADVIDALIDNGYLKSKKNSQGEIELIKIHEEDND